MTHNKARHDDNVGLSSGGAQGIGAPHARAMVDLDAKVVIGDILDEDGRHPPKDQEATA